MEFPHYIVLCLYCIAGVLLFIRYQPVYQKKKTVHMDIGASMTIGDRELQEDIYSTLTTSSGTMATLADGMGKAYGGRIASRISVNSFTDIFRDDNAFDNPQYYFRKAFHAANHSILQVLDRGCRGAASVGAILVRENQLYYAVAGNIKICVYRDGDLVPVSAGHTMDVLAENSFRTGKLSRQDALTLLESHRLYNYVGQDEFHDIELFDRPITLNKGDIITLMSDGLYDLLPWRDMEAILASGGNCQNMAFKIIEKVNQATASDKDNASIVLLRYTGGWQ